MIQLKKNRNIAGKATKTIQTQQINSQTRFRNNFENLEKKTNIQARIIFNQIHPTPYHHVYIEQLKYISQMQYKVHMILQIFIH